MTIGGGGGGGLATLYQIYIQKLLVDGFPNKNTLNFPGPLVGGAETVTAALAKPSMRGGDASNEVCAVFAEMQICNFWLAEVLSRF